MGWAGTLSPEHPILLKLQEDTFTKFAGQTICE